MQNKITIIIADDHPIFRKGLKEIIQAEDAFTIVGEAGDGEEALKLITDKIPAIAVLDIGMPQLGGMEVLKEIKTKSINTKIIFLTMHNDEEFLFKALDSGAVGYVLKDSAVSEIINAIKYVAEGSNYISPALTKYLINRPKKIELLSKKIKGYEQLTPVEKRIILLIAEHKTSKEIANELNISHRTVEKHRSNICKKLNLSGNYALLKFALEYSKKI